MALTGRFKFEKFSDLDPTSLRTLMKFSAVFSDHPNSRSSHGSQLPSPRRRLHSISRSPIWMMLTMVCRPSLRACGGEDFFLCITAKVSRLALGWTSEPRLDEFFEPGGPGLRPPS